MNEPAPRPDGADAERDAYLRRQLDEALRERNRLLRQLDEALGERTSCCASETSRSASATS